MDIMRTNTNDSPPLGKRRNYPADFKTQVMSQTQSPGNSVARVALQHRINPVTLHRWIREARQCQSNPRAVFIPIELNGHCDLPSAQHHDNVCVRMELGQGATKIELHWPMAAKHELSQWLKDWLR